MPKSKKKVLKTPLEKEVDAIIKDAQTRLEALGVDVLIAAAIDSGKEFIVTQSSTTDDRTRFIILDALIAIEPWKIALARLLVAKK